MSNMYLFPIGEISKALEGSCTDVDTNVAVQEELELLSFDEQASIFLNQLGFNSEEIALLLCTEAERVKALIMSATRSVTKELYNGH